MKSLLRRASARAMTFALAARLAACPEEAHATHKRRTALHTAVTHRASVDAIALLLTHAPAAASTPDLRLVLPLHLAAAAGAAASEAVCTRLLAAFPRARALLTKERKTPLHLALELIEDDIMATSASFLLLNLPPPIHCPVPGLLQVLTLR